MCYFWLLPFMPDVTPKGNCVCSWKQTSNISLDMQLLIFRKDKQLHVKRNVAGKKKNQCQLFAAETD